MSSPVLVNVGCGTVWHDAWRNYDLDPQNSSVQPIDLEHRLPLENESVDAIYHAHVLEHLPPAAGERFLAECFRVLKRSGVVRVVVPDLESIAERYLTALRKGDDLEYDWAVLELLDQLVRTKTEGNMGEFLRTAPWRSNPQVSSRVGTEIGAAGSQPKRKRQRRLGRLLARIRFAFARVPLSTREAAVVREAQFRAKGEIHRWMYDQRSLARVLQGVGFASPTVHAADTSAIPRFVEFHLDVNEAGRARHPDSLYMEAVKR